MSNKENILIPMIIIDNDNSDLEIPEIDSLESYFYHDLGCDHGCDCDGGGRW